MALIRSVAGLSSGRVRELTTGVLVFGRNPRLCDVVLDHYAVSREHARISVVGGIGYIEDLESRNGVLVNGRPIAAGAPGRQRLFSGDRIRIATFEFIYEEDPSSGFHLTDHNDDASQVLSTVALQGDSSVANVQSADSDKLQAILAIIEELAGTVGQDQVLSKILDSLFRSFPETEAGVILFHHGDGDYRPAASRYSGARAAPVRIGLKLVRRVAETRSATLIEDCGTEPDSQASADSTGEPGRSIMTAPLLRGDQVIGVIQLQSRSRAVFKQRDLLVLAGVARHLASVIANSQMHDAALKAQRNELEQRFRGLIEGSIQGVLVHRQLQPLFVNRAYAQLHGYTVAEVLALPAVSPLMMPEERERILTFRADLQGGSDLPARYEALGLRKDGTAIWLEKFVTVVDWIDGPAFQTAVIDVSDRKRAEEALHAAHIDLEQRAHRRAGELAEASLRLEDEIYGRKRKEDELRDSEALYRSLVDNIPLCVARKNLEGAYTFVNHQLAKLFGKRPEDFIGRTDHDLLGQEHADKYRRDDVHVANTGQLLELTETVQLPGGKTLYVQTLKTPIRDADYRIVGTQFVFWDITEQRKTEAECERYASELERSNHDLEQFAYSVSHDLQSPLRTIANYCQLVQQTALQRLTAEECAFLDNAVEGTRRMKRLLDDLLAYSRLSTKPEHFQLCDPNVILAEALRNLAAAIAESQAEITHDRLPPLVCDRTQLMMLFQNLISNAITYRRDVPPRIHVAAQPQDEDWVISVRDNGIGIEARYYDRIFQVFQRLHADHEVSGSGIGLAICKRIVERHGGKIWVESIPNEGSVFYFSIPQRSL